MNATAMKTAVMTRDGRCRDCHRPGYETLGERRPAWFDTPEHEHR